MSHYFVSNIHVSQDLDRKLITPPAVASVSQSHFVKEMEE